MPAPWRVSGVESVPSARAMRSVSAQRLAVRRPRTARRCRRACCRRATRRDRARRAGRRSARAACRRPARIEYSSWSLFGWLVSYRTLRPSRDQSSRSTADPAGQQREQERGRRRCGCRRGPGCRPCGRSRTRSATSRRTTSPSPGSLTLGPPSTETSRGPAPVASYAIELPVRRELDVVGDQPPRAGHERADERARVACRRRRRRRASRRARRRAASRPATTRAAVRRSARRACPVASYTNVPPFETASSPSGDHIGLPPAQRKRRWPCRSSTTTSPACEQAISWPSCDHSRREAAVRRRAAAHAPGARRSRRARCARRRRCAGAAPRRRAACCRATTRAGPASVRACRDRLAPCAGRCRRGARGRSALVPERSLQNASCVPSGLSAALVSAAGSRVMSRKPAPFTRAE